MIAQHIICSGVLSSTRAGEDLLQTSHPHTFHENMLKNTEGAEMDLFEYCLFLFSWQWTTCRNAEEVSFTGLYTEEL